MMSGWIAMPRYTWIHSNCTNATKQMCFDMAPPEAIWRCGQRSNIFQAHGNLNQSKINGNLNQSKIMTIPTNQWTNQPSLAICQQNVGKQVAEFEIVLLQAETVIMIPLDVLWKKVEPKSPGIAYDLEKEPKTQLVKLVQDWSPPRYHWYHMI